MKIYYNRKLKARSRELRNNSTFSEVLIWNQLKAKKIRGYQFMRQKPIDNYIVDFFCFRLKLVIEIDGDGHIMQQEYDVRRQKNIESLGLNFLRFGNDEVRFNMESVLKRIEQYIDGFEKINNEKASRLNKPPGPLEKGE